VKKINDTDLTLCNQFICERFELEPLENELSESELIRHLSKAIRFYLDKDFNKLLNILYRIDVKETDIKQILTASPPNEIAETLAVTVIDREKQKIQTRKKYRD